MQFAVTEMNLEYIMLNEVVKEKNIQRMIDSISYARNKETC